MYCCLEVEGPEMRDIKFSWEIFLDLLNFAHSLGMNKPFTLTINEKYEDEEVSHYAMKGRFETVHFLNGRYARKLVQYSAKAPDGVEHHGKISVIVYSEVEEFNLALVKKAFELYDRALLIYYPEWITKYGKSETKANRD
ncbi:MAG: hypothetical protein WC565_01430 [Parcubacteria group bacterium]